MFGSDFVAAHIIRPVPCVDVCPFVVFQSDGFPVEQLHRNEEWYLPVCDRMAEILLPFFEGLECR